MPRVLLVNLFARGHGFPKPALNVSIGLPSWLHDGMSDNMPNCAGALSYAECDKVFEYRGRSLFIDYHGVGFHSSQQDIHLDSLRANALSEQGIERLVLTKEQVDNKALFDKFVAQACAKLRFHPRKPAFDWDSRNTSLRKGLLDLDLFSAAR